MQALRWIILPFSAAVAVAAGIPADSGWTPWAARAEIAPRTWLDPAGSHSGGPALAVSGNSNHAAAGGWQRTVEQVKPERWYRFRVYYRTASIAHEPLQLVTRLDWRRADGKRAGQPDYAWRVEPAGKWKLVTLEAPAPKNAAAVSIQLYLQNAAHGTVWWDQPALEPIDAPGPRKVTVASVNLRPRQTGSAEASVRRFVDFAQASVPSGADVILLPEGITIVGTGKNYADVAEPVPGPTTARLGKLAQSKNAWVAAGIFEREGHVIYNTAVLIDRRGQVAGKYRKVYLPREEVEGGLTPGNDYPVFSTDFGRIGVMICWDIQYADPARQLARKGAELLLVPIWGGNQTLGKARAIENRVFIASSGYDYPTYVMDPDGEIIASAPEQGTAAVAVIDLNRRYADPWLGDMRGRFHHELRVDLQ
jgi:predicted amidohydrolase